MFQNGTNATTIQGSRSDGLEGFTFNFTASNLNAGITAAGSWSFNGTADRAQRTLESAGFLNEPGDAVNGFHPSDIDYNAVDYRSTGTAVDGADSGHFTVHVPVTTSYQPTPDGSFIAVRIPLSTVPTVGDVHFGEHNPFHSWEGLKKHSGEVRRSIRP